MSHIKNCFVAGININLKILTEILHCPMNAQTHTTTHTTYFEAVFFPLWPAGSVCRPLPFVGALSGAPPVLLLAWEVSALVRFRSGLGLLARLVWGLCLGSEGLAGGLAFFLTPLAAGELFSTLGGGEEEVTGHLVKGGVAWAFPPNKTTLGPMDTANGAHLHLQGVDSKD